MNGIPWLVIGTLAGALMGALMPGLDAPRFHLAPDGAVAGLLLGLLADLTVTLRRRSVQHQEEMERLRRERGWRD